MNNTYELKKDNFYIKIYDNMPYINNNACMRLIINMSDKSIVYDIYNIDANKEKEELKKIINNQNNNLKIIETNNKLQILNMNSCVKEYLNFYNLKLLLESYIPQSLKMQELLNRLNIFIIYNNQEEQFYISIRNGNKDLICSYGSIAKPFFASKEKTPPDKELINIINKVEEKREILNSIFKDYMIL